MIRISVLVGLVLLPVVLLSQRDQPDYLVFTHVTVIDTARGLLKSDMTVVIEGDRIRAIGKTKKVAIPRNARVIDATGKFLIPGLWDMHVHLIEKDRFFPMSIANGVTGLRDMGATKEQFETLKQLRRQVDDGLLDGPHIFTPGPMLNGPLAKSVYTITAATDKEGREAVRWLKENGADFVKVHSYLPREAYFGIADESRKLGLTFVGHIPLPVTAAEAASVGQKSIEHLIEVHLGCSNREDELRKPALDAFARGESDASWTALMRADANSRDSYDKTKAAKLFSQFRKNGIWHCPTLVAGRFNMELKERSFEKDPRLKYIPPSIQKEWMEESKDVSAENIEIYQKLYPAELALTGELNRAGVKLLAGTDTGSWYLYPGFSLHDELFLMVRAGLSPMQALQTATFNPAQFLGRLNDFGTVEKGKVADLVLLEANPLEDITNTRRIEAVILRGKFINKSELEGMLNKVETGVQRGQFK